MWMNARMRAGLAACLACMLVTSKADGQALRLTFSGTVTSVEDVDGDPLPFFTGVSEGDEIAYTLVFDFDRPALADGSRILIDDLNIDYYSSFYSGSTLPDLYSNVTNSFFASFIAGGSQGDVRGRCEFHFAFAGGGDAGVYSGTNFKNVMNFAGGVENATENERGFVMAGPTDDFLFFGLPGFDGTPEDLVVGVSQAIGSERLCDFIGVGQENGGEAFIIFDLTLVDKSMVENALEPGGIGSFVGRITDFKSGMPIACATVVAFTGNTAAGAGSTNQDGDYQIPNLGFGEYRVEVFAPDRESPDSRIVDLGSIANVQNYTLAVETSGGTIEGRVTDLDTSDPLAGVRVDALSLIDGTLLSTSFTCATGDYQLSDFVGAKGTTVLLRSLAPGYIITEMEASAGTQNNDFSMEKALVPGVISGVITQAGGDAVAGASVAVQSLSSTASQVQATDGEGFYLVPNLPPGQYSVNVSAPGFIAQTLGPVSIDAGAAAVSAALDPGATPAPVADTSTGEGSGAMGCSGGASSRARASGGTIAELLLPLLAVGALMVARRRRPWDATASRR